MSVIKLFRGAVSRIPFTITDSSGSLGGKRVALALGDALTGSRVLLKQSGIESASPDVTITAWDANTVAGTINIAVADFATLTADDYRASLWLLDAGGVELLCATAGGYDTLLIVPAVPAV